MQSIVYTIMCGLLLLGIYNSDATEPKWSAWLVFCLLVYNTCLNIMRQMGRFQFRFISVHLIIIDGRKEHCGIHSSSVYFEVIHIMYSIFRPCIKTVIAEVMTFFAYI